MTSSPTKCATYLIHRDNMFGVTEINCYWSMVSKAREVMVYHYRVVPYATRRDRTGLSTVESYSIWCWTGGVNDKHRYKLGSWMKPVAQWIAPTQQVCWEMLLNLILGVVDK